MTPAVLIALVAALFLLLGGDDVSVSSPIDVGTPPLRVAAGEGAVWVTSAADGTLTRIDPQTQRVIGEPLRLGPRHLRRRRRSQVGLGLEPARLDR